MDVHLLKSKIHRATVTGGDVNYEGSLTISGDLLDKCGLHEYEKILCGNMANGHRWETYVIRGKRGTGENILNGAVAHLGKKGDLLTIMNFAAFDQAKAKKWKPALLYSARETRSWTNGAFDTDGRAVLPCRPNNEWRSSSSALPTKKHAGFYRRVYRQNKTLRFKGSWRLPPSSPHSTKL